MGIKKYWQDSVARSPLLRSNREGAKELLEESGVQEETPEIRRVFLAIFLAGVFVPILTSLIFGSESLHLAGILAICLNGLFRCVPFTKYPLELFGGTIATSIYIVGFCVGLTVGC